MYAIRSYYDTYIAEGKSTLEEMIGGIERGIYAKYMGGGSVNPATGDFNFSVMEGYLVENRNNFV